jgi:hypothetical protein
MRIKRQLEEMVQSPGEEVSINSFNGMLIAHY